MTMPPVLAVEDLQTSFFTRAGPVRAVGCCRSRGMPRSFNG